MNIYYYFSNRSKWDIEQQSYLGTVKGIHQIPFKSAHHGIPFLKVALSVVLNLEDERLRCFENKVQHPLFFTIKFVGVRKTIMGFISQVYKAYKKRH